MEETLQDILEKTNVLSKEQLAEAKELANSQSIDLEEAINRLALLSEDQMERLYIQSIKLHDFAHVIVDMGFLSNDDLSKAREELKGSPISLAKHLLNTERLSEEQFARALAKQHSMEYVDLTSFEVDDELFRRFEVGVMRRYHFIPYSLEGRELIVIASDPTEVSIFDELEALLDLNIHVKLGTHSEISRLISLMVETSLDSGVLFGEVALSQSHAVLEVEDEEGAEVDVAGQERQAMQSSVVGLVDSVLIQAVRKQASDIHFEVYQDELKVRYRIDGCLFDVASFDKNYHSPVSSRLKIMAKLDIAEKRIPQDGRFRLHIDDRNVDFRVSVLPSVYGETTVLRILDRTALGLDLAKLGFEGENLLRFKRAAARPYGMVLVAGPTGSGKTTTLYSAIKAIQTSEQKIITIEDPVEYQLPGVVQIAVNERKGLTFASGLRSIVRQDPDRLLIGEIRDEETAKIAINAALTGHLVLSTIHANNVMDAVSRLIGMEIDPYEFVSSFNLIMSQRLVRKICPNCREEVTEVAQELRDLIEDFNDHKDANFFEGSGCRFCHKTGFSGRVGIFEMLVMSDRIKQMILNRDSPLETEKVAIEEGMVPLRQAAWQKVESGVTTLSELNRVTLA